MPTLTLNGIEMFYEITGEGPPLLLIHGLGSSGRDWEYQIPDFKDHYQVITVDLRGHGRSSKPKGPYSIVGFADDVFALLKALNFESVHVLGISMGTSVGFELVLKYPKMVRTFIGVNMGVSLPVKTIQEKWQFLKRTLIVKLVGMKKMGEFLAPRLFPDPSQEHLIKMVADRWAENDKKAYLTAMNALKNWSVEDKLSQIQVPTLIVASDGDYTPVHVKEEYVTKIPHAKLVVMEQAHHAVPVEKPEEFNVIALNFLKLHNN